MICDTIGLTADSYASMYVHGGLEVEEVYGGLNYADPIFYKSQTMTGSAPLVFDSYPGGLTDYTIFGNSYQDGTPTPDDPVEVVSVGDLVTSGEHAGEYVIQVTVSDGMNSQTYPIYLSEPLRKIGNYADELNFKTGTVTRRIKKVTLTGSERATGGSGVNIIYGIGNAIAVTTANVVKSNSYISRFTLDNNSCYVGNYSDFFNFIDKRFSNTNEFKEWLADQYAAGTPVTVWYVLATPTTESITLPTISTINGQNTLSFGTALQPSSVSITGHIKPVTS